MGQPTDTLGNKISGKQLLVAGSPMAIADPNTSYSPCNLNSNCTPQCPPGESCEKYKLLQWHTPGPNRVAKWVRADKVLDENEKKVWFFEKEACFCVPTDKVKVPC